MFRQPGAASPLESLGNVEPVTRLPDAAGRGAGDETGRGNEVGCTAEINMANAKDKALGRAMP
jgi:hypothetical protein